MPIYPPLKLTLLNGFVLILPMIALRYGIPPLMKKEALAELDYFPPTVGLESLALKGYFVSNTFLIISPLLAQIKPLPGVSLPGWFIYVAGMIILTFSLIDFCRQEGIKTAGVYRYSRNPMCVGYFFVFLGASLLISSWFHLTLTAIYQLTVHWLILSEERWCLEHFSESYQEYYANVSRYFII